MEFLGFPFISCILVKIGTKYDAKYTRSTLESRFLSTDIATVVKKSWFYSLVVRVYLVPGV